MYNFCNVCFNGFWCSFSLNYKKMNKLTNSGRAQIIISPTAHVRPVKKKAGLMKERS